MMSDKIGLVMGIANKRSIAWTIAKQLYQQGASLLLTYQNQRLEKNLEQLLQTLPPPQPNQKIYRLICDVEDETQIQNLFQQCPEPIEALDFVLHSIAFAPRTALENPLLETTWEDYQKTLKISAYSFLSIARKCAPLLAKKKGSLLTMTYLGSNRVVPGYNIMGVAKAALETTVRYLAYELGPQQIRVNAISAGPIRTLASAGIKGFSQMYQNFAEKNFLHTTLTPEDIAPLATFLLSPSNTSITGEILFADAGYQNLGI